MGGARAPDRGDVVWIEFTPQAGHEQAGLRPGLVVSPAVYNRASGLALVCPITRRSKGYPFEVALPPGEPVEGVILSDQVRSVDWKARRARRIGRASGAVVAEVRARVAALVAS